MDKINFEDLPSENSPIDASNLNQMQDNIENAIELKEDIIKDSGWIDLPLQDGITQYDTSLQRYACKYRKIGNHVWIKGCVKGISSESTVISQLPEGYRPINLFRYTTGHNVQYSDIYAIGTDGKLTFVGTINNQGTLADTDFHYIQVDYLID